jgi:hypothetical protein
MNTPPHCIILPFSLFCEETVLPSTKLMTSPRIVGRAGITILAKLEWILYTRMSSIP